VSASTDGDAPPATTLDGLRLGGGTFTRIPVAPPRVVDTHTGRVAILTAPLWGLLLGGIAGTAAGALWWWFGRDGSPSAVAAGLCAVVAVGVLAWLSRGLHLDGLADTIDGFASMRRGAEALAIMRDPHVGALGAAGLVLVLLLQVSALAVVVSQSGPGAVVAVMASVGLVSRAVLPWSVRSGTPASDTGLGQVVVGSVSPLSGGLVLGAGALVGVGLLMWVSVPMPGAIVTVVATVLVVGVVRRAATKRFGVINGDALGALVEAAVTCALVLVALSL